MKFFKVSVRDDAEDGGGWGQYVEMVLLARDEEEARRLVEENRAKNPKPEGRPVWGEDYPDNLLFEEVPLSGEARIICSDFYEP